MKRWRVLGILAVLVVCAMVVGVAWAANGTPPSKKQPGAAAAAKTHAAVKAKAAKVAPRSTKAAKESGPSESNESASETESAGDSAVDGVDAGGDHQCPPDCAPGENP